MAKPDFSGSWKCLTHDNNFDEYMQVLQRGWLFRKAAAAASITKNLSFGENNATDETIIAGLITAAATFPLYENEEEEIQKGGIPVTIQNEEFIVSGYWDGDVLVFKRISKTSNYTNILRLRKVDDDNIEITMLAIGSGKEVKTVDTYQRAPSL